MLQKARQLPALKNLPAGVRQITAGEAEFMMELFAGFGQAMVVGIVCVSVARAALSRVPATDHDPLGVTAFCRRRLAVLVSDELPDADSVVDRHVGADGHRDEELDLARGIRRSCDA